MRNKTRKLIHFKCIITGCTKCCWVPDMTRRTWHDSACSTAWHWWAGVPTALCSTPAKHNYFCVVSASRREVAENCVLVGLWGSFLDGQEDGERSWSGIRGAIPPLHIFFLWSVDTRKTIFPSKIISSEAKTGECVQHSFSFFARLTTPLSQREEAARGLRQLHYEEHQNLYP